ncbi:hypothetical protein Golax_020609, partial [Gossypium laxum]|nr:hypothetical protein [Gossypium laxum]
MTNIFFSNGVDGGSERRLCDVFGFRKVRNLGTYLEYKSHCKYPPPHHYAGSDKIAWGGTSSGSFSIKSAYKMVRLGIGVDECSTLCRHALEDILHAIRDCSMKVSWSADEIIKGLYTSAKQYASVNKVVHSTRQVVRGASTCTDQYGQWILGYNRRFKKCSIFDVELWGILEGLTLLQSRHCDRVLIQTDSME